MSNVTSATEFIDKRLTRELEKIGFVEKDEFFVEAVAKIVKNETKLVDTLNYLVYTSVWRHK